MAFIIEKEPKFWATVKVTTPTDDGPREDTFKARFILQPVSVVDQLESGAIKAAEFLDLTLIDLSDILDEDKKPVPFDAELKAMMLNHATARIAILQAYYRALDQGRAGN